MQSRFKLKLLNIFRSSFGSCRTRNLSDEIEKALCLPENQQDLHAAELPPKQLPHRQFPSICRPKCSNLNQSTIFTKDAMLPRCHATSWSPARVCVPILWLCFSGRNLGKLDSTAKKRDADQEEGLTSPLLFTSHAPVAGDFHPHVCQLNWNLGKLGPE
ncbi:hypothetical protein C1H46_026566 [Malus baccata]|uniref:Uncharacterized protein n=1 Tax=Malus baccata TaxID=106549 RepID=A0A540LN13_MALBA|nr:hypothetical protein C1H46_026566 [Malus baccata]